MPTGTNANNKHTEIFLNRNYTTVLRGLCMLGIVWSHTSNEFPDLLEAYHLTVFLNIGMFASGMFLFLSGYGLTLSIERNTIDAKYIIRHLKGLLLPFIIFWTFYVLVGVSLGINPHPNNNLLIEFLSLKMPNVDTWFLRTIFALYVIYFFFAHYSKAYAKIGICIVCALYVLLLAYNNAPSHLWNTLMCFPLGILCTKATLMRKQMNVFLLMLVVMVFSVSFVVLQNNFFGAVLCPILFCIIFAQLSYRVSFPPKVPLISYIGTHSIYMYLMEEIPIDYLTSGDVGFNIFVFGGIAITIAATYIGFYVEQLLTSKFSKK